MMCGEGEHLFVVGAIESLDCVKRVRWWAVAFEVELQLLRCV